MEVVLTTALGAVVVLRSAKGTTVTGALRVDLHPTLSMACGRGGVRVLVTTLLREDLTFPAAFFEVLRGSTVSFCGDSAAAWVRVREPEGVGKSCV